MMKTSIMSFFLATFMVTFASQAGTLTNSCPFPQTPYRQNLRLPPHSEGWLKTSGGSVYFRYIHSQPGPLVILVPGIPSALYFSDLMLRLSSAGFNVLSFDYPGKMNSSLHSEANLEFLIQQVEELFLNLGIKKHVQWHFVGTSMGSPLASRLAYKHQDRTRSLVLLNPVGLGRKWTLMQRMAQVPILNKILAPFVIKKEVKKDISNGLACPENYTELIEEQDTYLATLQNKWNYLNLIAHFGMKAHLEAFQRLNELSIPILVLSGEPEHDPLIDQVRALRQILPKAEFGFIPSTSHIPFVESPETTFQILESFFLRQVDP